MPIVSISINDNLLKELDNIQEDYGYSGRSELIRAAIRLIVNESRDKRKTTGNILALLIALHRYDIKQHVTHIQSKYLDVINTQLHSKFKEGKCMELFILDGNAARIKELSNELQKNEENDYVKLIII